MPFAYPGSSNFGKGKRQDLTPLSFHLTYCSNVHPGESWEEIERNLKTFVPPIQQKLAAKAPFGIGLRLSAQAAQTLEQSDNLARFKDFLTRQNCYVFTINGFPYGAFHKTRVKEEVYLPDWMDERRLEYSNRLARILASLLPDDLGEGSVSTVPCGFKERVRSEEEVRRMVELLTTHAHFLHQLQEETGKRVTLALEPEPCCYLETIDEVIAFFANHLFNRDSDRSLIRRHIGICYDACHMAVEFEEPSAALVRLKEAEISIFKVQASSAIRVQFQCGDDRIHRLLAPFAESTYLHQVVEKSSKGLKRYVDLPQALAAESKSGDPGEAREWRIHFHIPIFLANAGELGTTQDHLKALLDLLKKESTCPYLEVETYTWDVLPDEYKNADVVTAIVRELAWVRDLIKG